MKTIGLYTESIYYKGLCNYYSSDIFILFFQKIFPNEKINIIGRVNLDQPKIKYKLHEEKIFFFKLSSYKNLVSVLILLPVYLIRNFKSIKKFVKATDRFFVSTPGPISIVLILCFLLERKEITIFVRQDLRELIKQRYKGRISYFIANTLESIIELIVKKNPRIKVFTFGKVLKERYEQYTDNVFPITDTRYSKRDIIKKADLKKIEWKQDVKFLYVGRLEKGKGLENLLEVFKKVNRSNFSLTIIGDGSFKEFLELNCIKLRIDKKVIFKGFIPLGNELFQMIREHNIFILPSLSEGLPQIVLEAMASGLLTIGTNVGGIPDIIPHNENGFIYDGDDLNNLKKITTKV